MLDPSLKNLFLEIVSASLKPDQIEELGRMIFPGINIHDLSNKKRNFTLSSRQAAAALLEHSEDKDKTRDLIKLLVEVDNMTVLGKVIHIEGFEEFLRALQKIGLVYDFKKRRVVPLKEDESERKDWGALKDGKTYPITVISADIVGSSEMVKKYARRKVERFHDLFWVFLRERLEPYDGRIWSWAGDGGLMAFALKGHVERGVRFAYELQRVMPLFLTLSRNPVPDIVELRLGIHTGKVQFRDDTGKIISDVINLAAHLEKKATEPGSITLSQDVHNALPERLAAQFESFGEFEGIECFRSSVRLDLTC